MAILNYGKPYDRESWIKAFGKDEASKKMIIKDYGNDDYYTSGPTKNKYISPTWYGEDIEDLKEQEKEDFYKKMKMKMIEDQARLANMRKTHRHHKDCIIDSGAVVNDSVTINVPAHISKYAEIRNNSDYVIIQYSGKVLIAYRCAHGWDLSIDGELGRSSDLPRETVDFLMFFVNGWK